MTTRDLTNAMLASPDQASTAFQLGGAHPIRQKSLFIMRFLRKAGEGGEQWKDGLSFLVRSIDRPTVQPIVEELNQYNKKRIIHTGVKYSPVNCVLYDTADGAAMSMWVEYAQYYYGDYRQDASGYADDIISAKMLGTSGVSTSGYGFGISSTSTTSIDGANTQYFFDHIDIYQVWGGEYTCFQLLNPRISNFDPDDLDYESSSPNMITMSFTYEAIYHQNGGKPQKISQDATLVELFNGTLNGNVYEPQPSAVRTTDFTSTTSQSSTTLTSSDLQSLLNSNSTVDYTASDRSDTTTSTGGALSQYGSFDFGDFTSSNSTLDSELSTLTSNLTSNLTSTTDLGSSSSALPSWITTTKEANEYELARIQQSGQTANQDAVGSALGSTVSLSDIASGVSSAALMSGSSPSDQVSYGDDDYLAGQDDSSDDQTDVLTWAYMVPSLEQDSDVIPVPALNDAVVSGSKTVQKGGLSLSPLVLAAINTSSDGRSQLGQRKNQTNNPLLSYIVEPTPVRFLVPEMIYGRVATSIVISMT